MAKCSKCNKTVGCSCQLRVATSGQKVCVECFNAQNKVKK